MYFVYVVREKRHTELFTRASSWMTVVDNGGISMMQWSEHSPSTAVHYVLFLLLSCLLLRFFKGLFSFPFSVVTNIRNFDLAHFNKYWQNFRVMKQIVITLIRSINCQTIVGIWWHFSKIRISHYIRRAWKRNSFWGSTSVTLTDVKNPHSLPRALHCSKEMFTTMAKWSVPVFVSYRLDFHSILGSVHPEVYLQPSQRSTSDERWTWCCYRSSLLGCHLGFLACQKAHSNSRSDGIKHF